MSFDDPHTPFVMSAYAASAVILIALIWASAIASRKARRALESAEKERGR